jgi:gas vesicle protein
MRKTTCFMSLLTGFGVGIAASIMFAPEAGQKMRRRIRVNARHASGLFKKRADMFTSAAGEVLQNGHQEISRTMTGFTDKAKEKIDDAADATKKAADQVIDKSRDVAHHMGKKMEEAGKRLQNA